MRACMHACCPSKLFLECVCEEQVAPQLYITHYFNIPKVWSWVCQTPKAPLNTAPFAHSAYLWRASLFFFKQISCSVVRREVAIRKGVWLVNGRLAKKISRRRSSCMLVAICVQYKRGFRPDSRSAACVQPMLYRACSYVSELSSHHPRQTERHPCAINVPRTHLAEYRGVRVCVCGNSFRRTTVEATGDVTPQKCRKS